MGYSTYGMKVLIVEDQTMVRELLVLACQSIFDIDSIFQAADGAEGLEQCKEVKPNLVILDLELPDKDGLDLLPDLRKTQPGIKVIALSSHTDEVTVHRVIQSNIEGFVDKNEQPIEMLKTAISSVMDGRRYLSPVVRSVWKKLVEETASFNKLLSDREQEILALIGRGYTNQEISDIVGLKVVTVQNHRCNIMSKLDLHSTSHLIRYAMEKGFTRLKSFSE